MESSIKPGSLSQKTSFDPDYLQEFEAKVFIEGTQTNRRLVNFFVLLLLATVIATYGVLSNSTATVIGAMIVAPLMGPIMATAAAVVMGSAQRAWRSLALVIIGVVCVILFSVLLSLIVPKIVFSFTNNGEITSRIHPGLLALITALAAGAAGAFITSRAEIADSMGGVAIAISLVPPLCVVGIAISQGEWTAAWGALLLFLTNFLAILLAGGIVFVLVGLGKLVMTKQQAHLRRRSFLLIILGTLLVSIPLSLNAYQTIMDSLAINQATTIVQSWLEGTTYQIVAVNVSDEVVAVSVEGEGEMKSLELLDQELEEAIQHPVIVNLRVIPVKRVTSPGS